MINASVIVSTYNGAAKIPYLFDGLAKQTYRMFELLVVVDGSTDNTLDVLRTYEPGFSSFRVIDQDNSGRSKVRNRGAKEAVGDLLIFYDDDMVPDTNSVERHLLLHADRAPKLVTGNSVEMVKPDKTDIQNYKASRTELWTKKYGDLITLLSLDNLFFTAANCSIARDVFERLGGFDERLTDAEDFHLAKRAIEKGIPVYFDKSNRAIHREFITAGSYIRRLREYKKAHEVLALLFPDHTVQSNQESYQIRRLIYRILAHSRSVRWIDEERLKFMPRKMRYKLYDMIIHSLSVEYPDIEL